MHSKESGKKCGGNPPGGFAGGGRGGRLKLSALLDTRLVYCGDKLEQLAKLPDGMNLA